MYEKRKPLKYGKPIQYGVVSPFKSMNYDQAFRFFNLTPHSDIDRDGVPNWRDCRPYDQARQDIIKKLKEKLGKKSKTSASAQGRKSEQWRTEKEWPYEGPGGEDRTVTRRQDKKYATFDESTKKWHYPDHHGVYRSPYGEFPQTPTGEPTRKQPITDLVPYPSDLPVEASTELIPRPPSAVGGVERPIPITGGLPEYPGMIDLGIHTAAGAEDYYVLILSQGKWRLDGKYGATGAQNRAKSLKGMPGVEKVQVTTNPNLITQLNRELLLKKAKVGAKGVLTGMGKGAKMAWRAGREYSKEQKFAEHAKEGLRITPEGKAGIRAIERKLAGAAHDWPVNAAASSAWATRGTTAPAPSIYDFTPKDLMRQQNIRAQAMPTRPYHSVHTSTGVPSLATGIQPVRSVQAIQGVEQPSYEPSYAQEQPYVEEPYADDESLWLGEVPEELREYVGEEERPRSATDWAYPRPQLPSIYERSSPFADESRRLPSAGFGDMKVQRYSPVSAQQAFLHKPLATGVPIQHYATPRGTRGLGLTGTDVTGRPQQPLEPRRRGLGMTGGVQPIAKMTGGKGLLQQDERPNLPGSAIGLGIVTPHKPGTEKRPYYPGQQQPYREQHRPGQQPLKFKFIKL